MTDELQDACAVLQGQGWSGFVSMGDAIRALIAAKPAGDDADGALPEPLDFWADLTPRERKVWGAGYRKAEDDYHVRRIPQLVQLAVAGDHAGLFDHNPAHRALIEAFEELVTAYNDEGTL